MANTPQAIINSAMRLLGVLGDNESPTPTELATGLEALNMMLDAWALERLMLFDHQEESFPLSAGVNSYTIGSGGVFNTTRPIRINWAYVRDSANNDSPVSVLLSRDEYADIHLKNLQAAWPECLYYEASNPLGVIFVFPTAGAGSYTLKIGSDKQLSQIAVSALATPLTLPPGYERALKYNLAKEIASEFGQAVPAVVASVAIETKAAIKTINRQPVIARTDVPTRGGRYLRNINDRF